MCLILFSLSVHEDYPLVVAANRDEFLDRPTAVAAPWQTQPMLVAGKDLKEGGTWLGVSADGAFSAITNYRDPAHVLTDAPTRGRLVTDYLCSGADPETWMNQLHRSGDQHNGYNLLTYEGGKLVYHSNRRTESPEILTPGFHGLSNHLINTPWPKVERGLADFRRLHDAETLDIEDLFGLLRDETRAPDDELPETGVPQDVERALSSVFIETPGYGTRCSTVVLFRASGEVEYHERSFGPAAVIGSDRKFVLNPDGTVEQRGSQGREATNSDG